VLAFSDIGGSTGNPTFEYFLEQPILSGADFGTHYVSRVERQANFSNIGNVTRALLTQAGDIPVGNMIKSIMLRQYQEVSGQEGVVDQSAGASLFLGLNTFGAGTSQPATGIKRVYLMRNANIPDWELGWTQLVDVDRNIWFPMINRPSIASIDDQAGMPVGYTLLDFTQDSGTLEDAYDLRSGFPPNKIQLYLDSVAVPASSRIDVLYQEVVAF
jgi:hypothetical protein